MGKLSEKIGRKTIGAYAIATPASCTFFDKAALFKWQFFVLL
jgi:hypothetical protein